MSKTPIDAELVLRAKAADPHALTAIYERYAPAIYRYIYCRVGDADTAEDLCADVFVRMLEGIDRYEDRDWPVSAWLYRIAHDRAVDMLRRRRTRSQSPIRHWSGTVDGPEQTVLTYLDCEEVRRRMSCLTEDQQAVIKMRFLQDMSVQEVAEALGRTEGAVKALQHRGVQTLARQFQEQDPSSASNLT